MVDHLDILPLHFWMSPKQLVAATSGFALSQPKGTGQEANLHQEESLSGRACVAGLDLLSGRGGQPVCLEGVFTITRFLWFGIPVQRLEGYWNSCSILRERVNDRGEVKPSSHPSLYLSPSQLFFTLLCFRVCVLLQPSLNRCMLCCAFGSLRSCRVDLVTRDTTTLLPGLHCVSEPERTQIGHPLGRQVRNLCGGELGGVSRAWVCP